MEDVNKIIGDIPSDQMADAYQRQKATLEQQLATNATAYILQKANTLMSKENLEKVLNEIGKSIGSIKLQLDDIDKRLNASSEALIE